jgi:hypothetical protein
MRKSPQTTTFKIGAPKMATIANKLILAALAAIAAAGFAAKAEAKERCRGYFS